MNDGILITISWFVGLLPYLKFERELAALPYMTRDFIAMKKEERRQATTKGKKAFYTFYIYLV